MKSYIIREQELKKLTKELKKYKLRLVLTVKPKSYVFDKIDNLEIYKEEK